jgi:hypothetical protein
VEVAALGFFPHLGTRARVPPASLQTRCLRHSICIDCSSSGIVSMGIMRPLARSALFFARPTAILPTIQRVPVARYQSTSSDAPATAALSPRWLSDVRTRIGKCIDFGINPAQRERAGSILQEIVTDCQCCHKKNSVELTLTSLSVSRERTCSRKRRFPDGKAVARTLQARSCLGRDG